MAQKELKWYDILSILFGIILGFADPITDILTLIEFYRADHKTWFMVGLAFILLPSVLFSLLNMATTNNDQISESWCRSLTTFLFGCNPLFPAFMKLRTLFAYLKKLPNLWRDNQIEPIDIRTNENELNSPNDIDNLLEWSKFAFVIEATFQSAPQFIIQLHAIVVQQESVSIIQMVSLPVSFLSVVWASTSVDMLLHGNERGINFSVKDRILLFITHLFILSSRLFAVAFHSLILAWFAPIIVFFHCLLTTMFYCDHGFEDSGPGLTAFLFGFCFHWLRDDWSYGFFDSTDEGGEIKLRESMAASNFAFVLENFVWILLFYFSDFPHTWFSLPVTIFVCLFSVVGAIMRLIHFCYLKKEPQNDV